MTRKTLIPVFIAVTLILAASRPLSAERGTVYLTNGHAFSGDITRPGDGSLTVFMKNCSVKFEKSEIKKVVFSRARGPRRSDDAFMASFRATPGARAKHAPRPTKYDNLINEEARKNDIDPALVKAVIKAESNFNARDRSSKGACGLMQLMPDTARILGVDSIYSPAENIRGGTRYLKDMLYTFNGDVELALAAYNAGPSAVKKYGKVPPYRETRAYVNNVKEYFRNYRSNGEICVFTDPSGCLNITNVR